jgi:hypothetical protein
MDELLAGLELPSEAYPEYLSSLAYAFDSWPLMLSLYALIAVAVATLLVRRLRRFRPGYLRSYLQSAIVLIAVLPGAYGDGGLVFLPLAGVLLASLVTAWPALFIYNLGLLAVALGLSAIVAAIVHAVARRRGDEHAG